MKTLLLTVAIFLVPSLSQAAPITFGFTGDIFTGVVGPFSGTYTFDSDAGPPSNQDVTIYSFSGGPYGMTVQVADGQILKTDTLSIFVGNNQPISGIGPFTDAYFVSTSVGHNNMGIGFRDCFGQAFDSTALPLVPPALSLFRPNCSLGDEVVIPVGIGNFSAGTLTSLFLAPQKVPEPASWLLFGVGLIVMVRMGYGRSGKLSSGSSVGSLDRSSSLCGHPMGICAI